MPPQRRRFPLAVLALLALPAGAAPPVDPEGALGRAAVAGFARAEGTHAFAFPQDHGPHEPFRQEWWYFTGHLQAPGGERFGFEVTFFRFALAPPGSTPAPVGASAWRTREIYMAHFAVTDVAGRRFEFAQKLSRAALDLAGATAPPLRVWVDDWALTAEAGEPLRWHVRARQPRYALQLDLESQGAPVLNGTGGLSVKSAQAGAASWYYSLPRLTARGTLSRDGVPLEVAGTAWFDHEWGSSALSTRQSGWDWFAFQLDDGSTFMFYALRDRDGRRDPHSAGTFVDAAGAVRPLATDEVELQPTGSWTSADGVRYPAGWQVRVPALALDLAARPVLADQELRTRPRYWEGAVQVQGTRGGAPAGGRGYVELVGYAQERCPEAGTGAHRCVAR
ncbi:MAG: carotenoid 1,2-hydratase [Proteobacteria bacterium]|nr:carotenoid 1,2-hydratase [Pseudomonadota bacterium]